MAKRYFKNVLSDSRVIDLNTSYYDFWKNKVYNLTEIIGQNASSSRDNDLYTGTTGIAYMFFYLATSDRFKNDPNDFYDKAIAITKLKENNFDRKSSCQFICGDAGVNAVNAVIYSRIGDEKTAEMYLDRFVKGLSVCKPIDFFKPGGDELFVGRAGYLYGILWLEKMFGRQIIADKDIIELCSTIVESGRKYSKKNKSIFPLMYSYYNTEYLGKHILILNTNLYFKCISFLY